MRQSAKHEEREALSLKRFSRKNLDHLIRLLATDDTQEADRLVAANRAVYDRVRAAGGTLYPASVAIPMSVDDWEQHFWPAFAPFRQAKATYDPDHVLTPGYEVFERR